MSDTVSTLDGRVRCVGDVGIMLWHVGIEPTARTRPAERIVGAVSTMVNDNAAAKGSYSQ